MIALDLCIGNKERVGEESCQMQAVLYKNISRNKVTFTLPALFLYVQETRVFSQRLQK